MVSDNHLEVCVFRMWEHVLETPDITVEICIATPLPLV